MSSLDCEGCWEQQIFRRQPMRHRAFAAPVRKKTGPAAHWLVVPHIDGTAAQRRQQVAHGVSRGLRWSYKVLAAKRWQQPERGLLPPLRGSMGLLNNNLPADAGSYLLPSLRDSRNVGNEKA